jgi:hypothetical protein
MAMEYKPTAEYSYQQDPTLTQLDNAKESFQHAD